jgi:hypothetical protein
MIHSFCTADETPRFGIHPHHRSIINQPSADRQKYFILIFNLIEYSFEVEISLRTMMVPQLLFWIAVLSCISAALADPRGKTRQTDSLTTKS